MRKYELLFTRSGVRLEVDAGWLEIAEHGTAVFKDRGSNVIFAVPAHEYVWVKEIK